MGPQKLKSELAMMKCFRHGKQIFLAGFLTAGLLGLASSPAPAAPVYNKPFYNPETKSYFELYSPDADDPKRNSVRNFGTIDYGKAMVLTAKRRYKGSQGRLAVVKTRETHEFLAKHLRPAHSAWIGLRYYCRFKKLMWVNGEVFKVGKDYARWGPQTWRLQGGSPRSTKISDCYRNDRGFYLPVHYWGMSEGFFWNANGHAKGFNAMIIEYKTGAP